MDFAGFLENLESGSPKKTQELNLVAPYTRLALVEENRKQTQKRHTTTWRRKAIGTFTDGGPNYSDSEMRAQLNDVHTQLEHAVAPCPTPVLTQYFLWSHFPVFLVAELRF